MGISAEISAPRLSRAQPELEHEDLCALRRQLRRLVRVRVVVKG